MSIRAYLPSKKLLTTLGVLFGGILFALLIGFLFRLKTTSDAAKKAAMENQADIVVVGDLVQKDSDSDGLPDWEEPLWGMDPLKKDTNDDGTSDFDDVKVKKAKLQKTSASGTAAEKQNQTEHFAREFFAAIMALQQSGNLNAESTNALANSFLLQMQNYPETTRYTKADVHTGPENPTVVYDYFKMITDNIGAKKKINDNSIMIVGLAMYEDRTDQLKELAAIAGRYEKIENAFKAATVPIGVVDTHLALMNTYHNIAQNIRTMALAEEDPMPAVSAIIHYENNISALVKNLSDLKKYVDSYL